MHEFNNILEDKIPLCTEDINRKLGTVMDTRFHNSCRNASSLKLVLADMYHYSTELYIYTSRMLEVLMDEDYTLERKMRIQEKFQYIIKMLDGYRAQYKSRCSNLDE